MSGKTVESIKKIPDFDPLDAIAAWRAKRKIEAALHIRRPEEIENRPESYDRAYFGCEFNEASLPGEKELKEAVARCDEAGKKLTLVTPVMSDRGLAKFKGLLAALGDEQRLEIVFNDFGALKPIRDRGHEPVAGRVVMKQKSDPRLAAIKDEKSRAYLRQTGADNRAFCELLKAQGMKRLEFDNAPNGFAPPDGFFVSLYFPFVFLTMNMEDPERKDAQDAKSIYILKSKGFPATLYLAGNSQFYLNKDVSILEREKIDRIVIQPALPE